MFFHGPAEPVATMLIPGAAATFMVAVPLIGRRMGAKAVTVGIGLLMTGVVLLTGVGIMADRGDEEYQKALEAADSRAAEARVYAKEGVVPLGGPAVFFNDPQYKIKALFKEHCQSCHALGGQGGGEAPDFTDYGSKAWIEALIRDPNTERFFGKTKMNEEMSSYEELPDTDIDALVEYVWELRGEEAGNAKAVARAKELWEEGDPADCSTCHEVEPGVEGDGPNLSGRGTVAWVERVIQDSGAKDLFGDYAEMPKFKDKLGEEEIKLLAEFVVSQGRKQ
jgi:cbb3-type cytochrome c oxidase subunit III